MNFMQSITNFYTKQSTAQKIALSLFIAASLGVIIFVSNWATRPEYGVLFANLEENDAVGIVEYLTDRKINFKESNDGGTILVTPKESVYDIRMKLSSSGLPRAGSKGVELLDSSSLTPSSIMENIKALVARQGELERTIQAIDAVKNVRVHITNPERSSTIKKDVLPTASVLLRLKVGAEITTSQVKAITHLVAASIEGLLPENITVMDTKGTLLSNQSGDGDFSADAVVGLDRQRNIENSYAKRIESMISEILGSGKVIARVTADIDYNKFEKEEELYDPAGSVARSEKVIEDNAVGKGLDSKGVVSNARKNKEAAAAGLYRETAKNFEISRAVNRTASAAGKIQRLSVAVLVDGQYVKTSAKEKDKNGVTKEQILYRPLSSEMIRKIDNLVKQSVGFDSTRGDVITIENIQFLNDDSLEQQFAEDTPTTLDKYLPFALPALFIILFFFLLKPMIKFLVTPSPSGVDITKLLPEGLQELAAEIEAERGKTVSEKIHLEELAGLIAANSNIVKQNPQRAALLIRYWLNEGRL